MIDDYEPPRCKRCREAYYEERAYDGEDLWCGRLNTWCSEAIKECD